MSWIAAGMVHLIMICGQPLALIVEDEVDDRTVSMPMIIGYPVDDSKRDFMNKGIKDAFEQHQVFKYDINPDSSINIECPYRMES